ncbi:efflux RND transporter periplasmic adaptor subunit [Capnocytophaga sp. oral taxon 338]|uniref:efflux RND transporter periplasmic adaptor subunit n=1 Tax=Capnocytophaga sp. oral taxon 338 TaxID=710239 RepID=UPI000202ED8A|nr:efflux RND transporter periplasmic adaptor subunit [Capnocytophaga sp. oral taxon 338]EGD33154.1 efflux transporter, RND family, MFP subunit [Capnocytophaga sp. oral taxon 338 str. F0234]
MKKILTVLIVIAIMSLIAYRLYSNKEKNAQEVAIVAQKEAQVAVRAVKVTRENVSDLFTANGTFVAEQDLNVSSEVGGQIIKIYVKEGDYVKAGQVLATTKADRTNVQLENAKAVLENAKADLKRFESAYQTGGVTAQQLEQARLQLKNAQANYNSAAIVSGDTSVRSKISGIVSSKEVEEGTLVSAGQPLFNVVNIDNLKLKITVDEDQVGRLKVGEMIKIKLSTSSQAVEGKIIFIAPKSNGALKFPVEILVANKNRELKAGMYATAQFDGQTENTTALVVPHAAFVGSVSQNKIFKIVTGKNSKGENVLKAEMVIVKSGRNFGDKVEILSGLTQGEEVITSGQINIDNGTPVRVVE